MPRGIPKKALRFTSEGAPYATALVSRHSEKWMLATRIAGVGSRWLPVRSRYETLRT